MYRRADFWILALLAAVLLWTPLRSGDLAGFDDALYSTIAKDMLYSGNWLDEYVSGSLAVETHPPMLEWMQGGLFKIFGISDTAAKVPSAVCAFGTIVLVFWLTRRLTGDPFTALIAMFVMSTSLYFIKYASHAMTDVPVTFFFACAMCAWALAEDRPAWYLAAGAAVACATMTRSLTGIILIPIFVAHALVTRRRPSWRYTIPALVLAVLPLTAWYARMIYLYRDIVLAHVSFLSRAVYGEMSPPWRKYTGAPEYAWMLIKSYWPWLPAMIAGIAAVWRGRDRRLYLVLLWAAGVFALCAVVKSRVLRYMLPAYPAYAILAAAGLAHYIPRRYLTWGMRVGTVVLAAVVLTLVVSPRTRLSAAEIRPVAVASTAATAPGERVVFWDGGLRTDEANQMEWYGDRFLIMPVDQPEFDRMLATLPAHVFVIDEATYQAKVEGRLANQVVARSGHFICVRVCESASACAGGTFDPPLR